jgi:hypothetical protein
MGKEYARHFTGVRLLDSKPRQARKQLQPLGREPYG